MTTWHDEWLREVRELDIYRSGDRGIEYTLKVFQAFVAFINTTYPNKSGSIYVAKDIKVDRNPRLIALIRQKEYTILDYSEIQSIVPDYLLYTAGNFITDFTNLLKQNPFIEEVIKDKEVSKSSRGITTWFADWRDCVRRGIRHMEI